MDEYVPQIQVNRTKSDQIKPACVKTSAVVETSTFSRMRDTARQDGGTSIVKVSQGWLKV
jgi:hypothetical protein